MSRVVEIHRAGGPEVLEIREAAIGEPAADEVRIRVKALGINRVDMMWRMDQCTERVKFPARLGYEAAGIAEAVGSQVTHIAAGDLVSVIPAFSLNQYGMYGEVVMAPAVAVVRSPPGLTFVEAASIWMMFITAYGALIEIADLQAGETVLVTAASSSVGLAAIQIATRVGAIPVAITRTSAKRKQLLDAGAAYVVAVEEQDLVREVSRITNGTGARVAFDSVGGSRFAELVQSLSLFGTIFVYGMLSKEPTQLPMLDMVGKFPIIRGHTIWTTASNPGRLTAAVDFISSGLTSGRLRPVIDRVFPFDQLADAHRYMERNEHFGKIVVSVGE